MKDERVTYWNKGVAVISLDSVKHLTTHVVECGFTISHHAKVNYLPGVLIIAYSRCYINIFILNLFSDAFLNRNSQIRGKEIL